MTRWRNPVRTVVLGLVLALAAVVVPNSSVAPTQAALVKFQQTDGVDVHPNVVWVLAVGSDARQGQDMLRTRGDALQMIGINTRTGAATAIGIPRDSWVPIPGRGSSRVNAALFFGGPQLLGETVGNLIGVQPDYVFVTRFQGLREMVNSIGGIRVQNPRYFSDSDLWPQGFKQGSVRVNGHGATAFGRIRKSLPGGDFDRSANQQRVLRGIHERVLERAAQPGFVERGVTSVMQHLHTDLGPVELFKLAQAGTQVDAGKITNCVLPGSIGNVGGASVVFPSTSKARSWGDQARTTGVIKNC
ncbi:LCP family protein [Nocardioides panacisoli]|uniref:LCP family protein n=1 Tax=Nocardioides panacisoli TaxID=627624 RepID=UPI001C625938|nr:LCP family protein [Nocardioides panacisoli]QYJ05641.1 LCP family protein [Nocardioides panacisoli]